MGNQEGKPSLLLPTPTVLKRISECVLPHDKEAVMDYLEILDFNLKSFVSKSSSHRLFLANNGIEIILNTMKISTDDEIIFGLCANVLETQIGGFNTMVDYESKFTDSTTIVSSLHNIKESIINWGSGLAIKEIAYQYDMLRLCETCQHSLEHGKRNSSPHPMYLAANINERVDRILDFMEVYPMKYALQCIALDALHLFVEKGNILKIKASPKLLPTVGKTLMEYVYTKPAIIWRAAVILQIVASLDQDLARDVALLEVHEPLCQAYSRLKRRPKIQQIILRFMGALAQWSGTSRVALLRSTVCMNLLTAIEAKVTEARHQVRAVEAEAKENLLKNFSQILTLELRSLIRESGGQRVFLPMEGQHAIHQQLFHRETVQQMALLKPLFGTTATKYFTPGDPGLL